MRDGMTAPEGESDVRPKRESEAATMPEPTSDYRLGFGGRFKRLREESSCRTYIEEEE